MSSKSKKGFTIVELVIVIAVIAILATVLIPTFNSIINSAKESKIKQEIKNSLILLSTNHPNIDLEKLIIVYYNKQDNNSNNYNDSNILGEEYIFSNEKQELELLEYNNYSINDGILAIDGTLYYEINKFTDSFPDNIFIFSTKEYAELLNPNKPDIKEEKYKLIIDDNSQCIDQDEISRVEGEYKENDIIYITIYKGDSLGELIIYVNEKEVTRISAVTTYTYKLTMPKEDVVIRTELVNHEGLYLSKVEEESKKYFTKETLEKITGEFKPLDTILIKVRGEEIDKLNINESLLTYINDELICELKGEDVHSGSFIINGLYVIKNEDITIRIEKKVDNSFIGLGTIYPFINTLSAYSNSYSVLEFEEMNYDLNQMYIKSCHYINDYYASISNDTIDIYQKQNSYIDFIKTVKYYKIDSNEGNIDPSYTYQGDSVSKVYRIIDSNNSVDEVYDFLYKDRYEYNGEIYVAEKIYEEPVIDENTNKTYYNAFINPSLVYETDVNDNYVSKVYPFISNSLDLTSGSVFLTKCDFTVQTFDLRSLVFSTKVFSPTDLVSDLNKHYGFSVNNAGLAVISTIIKNGDTYQFLYNKPYDSTLQIHTIVSNFKFSDVINTSTKEVNKVYKILSSYENSDELKLIREMATSSGYCHIYYYNKNSNELLWEELKGGYYGMDGHIMVINSEDYRLISLQQNIDNTLYFSVYQKVTGDLTNYINFSTGSRVYNIEESNDYKDIYCYPKAFKTLLLDNETIIIPFIYEQEGYLYIYLNGMYYDRVWLSKDENASYETLLYYLTIDSKYANYKDINGVNTKEIVVDYEYCTEYKEFVNLKVIDDDNIVMTQETIDSLNKPYLKGSNITLNFENISNGTLIVYANDSVKDVIDITSSNQTYELIIEENTSIKFEYTEIVPVDNTITLSQIYPWIEYLNYNSVSEVISFIDIEQLIKRCTYIDNTDDQSLEEIKSFIEGLQNTKYIYNDFITDKSSLVLNINYEFVIKDKNGDVKLISIPPYINIGDTLYHIDNNPSSDITPTYDENTYIFGNISEASIYRYGTKTDETIDLRTLVFKETIRNDNYDYTTDVSFKMESSDYHVNIIGNKELKISALEGDYYLEVVSDLGLNNYINNPNEVTITVKSENNLDEISFDNNYLYNFSKTIILDSNKSISKYDLFNLTTLDNYNYLYGNYEDYDYYIGDGKLFYNMLGNEILYDVTTDVEITIKSSDDANLNDCYEVVRSCSENVLEAGAGSYEGAEMFAISSLPSFMSSSGYSDVAKIVNTYEELEVIYNEMFTGEYPYYRMELFCDENFFKDNIMVVYGRKSTVLYYNYYHFSYNNTNYVEKKDGVNYSQFLDSQTYSVDFIKVPRKDLINDIQNNVIVLENLNSLKEDTEEYFKTTINDINIYMVIDGYIIYSFNNTNILKLGEFKTFELYGDEIVCKSIMYIYDYETDNNTDNNIKSLSYYQDEITGLSDKVDYLKTVLYTYNKYLHNLN